LVVKKKCTFFSLAKGPSYACEFKKQEAELTSEMMASGAWQAADFKAYNFDAEGAATGGGYFHPLLKVPRHEKKKRGAAEETNKLPTVLSSLYYFRRRRRRSVALRFFILGFPLSS